mgnify:CR=1 FL=1
MPKVDIDYSNTIFYKIYCKDSVIDDLYIGHTTNFVQRKYAHKQGCKNNKSSNYNCKLYKTIRDNMGWDNWSMEIIAFHNCDDLYAAKKLEQSYFEDYKATLNSIEPLPKPKLKLMKYTPPSERPHCEVCNVYFGSTNLLDIHNTTKKHRQNVSNRGCLTTDESKIRYDSTCFGKFDCEVCNFKSCNKKDYNRHLLTRKHTKLTNNDKNTSKLPIFVCDCGKQYKYRQGLHYHKNTCNKLNDEYLKDSNDAQSQQFDSTLIVELLKRNKELHEMIIGLAKNHGNTTIYNADFSKYNIK